MSKPFFRNRAEGKLEEARHYIEHQLPAKVLIVVVFVFGYLGVQGPLLLHDLWPHRTEVWTGIGNREPGWQFVIVLLVVAAAVFVQCLQFKRIAFLAAVQLRERFQITLVP